MFLDTHTKLAHHVRMPSSLYLQLSDEVSQMLDNYVERLKAERPESRTTRHSAANGLLQRALEAELERSDEGRR